MLSGLLGVANGFGEPASMARFADEGTEDGGVARFGIGELVRRPGSVLAPALGGVPMSGVGIAFLVGGAASLSGGPTLLGGRSYSHGAQALTRW